MIVQMCFEQERINAAILLLITRSRAAEVGVHFTFQNVRNNYVSFFNIGRQENKEKYRTF